MKIIRVKSVFRERFKSVFWPLVPAVWSLKIPPRVQFFHLLLSGNFVATSTVVFIGLIDSVCFTAID